MTISDEVKRRDRIHFDKVVFGAFEIELSFLDKVYKVLNELVSSRTTLKDKG